MQDSEVMDINLLIIDEDEDTLEVSKELFGNFVKKIYVASDIKTAKKYVQNFKLDVIVTDLRIKNSYSMELIKECKALQDDLYTILITSFGSEFIDFKDDIAKLGITRFLTKPFKIDILLNMLSEIDTLKKTKHYYTSLKDINNTLEDEILKNSKLLEDKNYIISSQSRYVILGEMFSMIMHQLMQPIQAIKMISSILKYKSNKDMLSKEYIIEQTDQMTKSCDFLAETILSFRNFNKADKNKDRIEINEVIEDTIKLIKVTLEKNNIAVNINIKDDTPKVEVCKNELVQVILNLINNAKDALIINKIEEPKINIEAFYDDCKHTIIVKDNGGGVPESIQKSVFKPHFTTKGENGGSGLGLYMSKMIIESSLNGTIKLENIDGGASFIISI